MIILWILFTLLLVSSSAIIAKKYGPEYIMGMFAGLVVISNILANKIVMFYTFAVPAGIIVYSSTFLLSDMLCEFYGKKAAKKAVWSGFLANIVLVVSIYIAINWTSASFWTNQDAFVKTLGLTYRIVIASLIAYLLSQFHDVWLFNFLKKKTKNKFLWLRNNTSTIISQLIDSIVFVVIAFYGVIPNILQLILGLWVVKIIIALLDTPFMYAVKWYYKK